MHNASAAAVSLNNRIPPYSGRNAPSFPIPLTYRSNFFRRERERERERESGPILSKPSRRNYSGKMPLRNNGTSRGWLAPATGPTLIKQESKYKIRIEERDSELSFFALVAVTGGRGGKNPRFFPLCPASSCPQTPDNVLENDVRSRQQRRTNDPETIEIIVAFPGSYCRLNRGTRNWSRLAQGEIRRGAGFARKSSLECENQRRQPLVSQLPDRSGCRGTFTRANARKPRMCVCVCVCVCVRTRYDGVSNTGYARIYRGVDARAKEDETCKSRSARATRRDENMRKRRTHARRGLRKRGGRRGKG